MNQVSQTQFAIKRTLIGWMIFLLVYTVSKNISFVETYSAFFPLIGESGLDLLAAILTYKLMQKIDKYTHKKILLILCASFLASFCADIIYNVITNFIHFRYEDTMLIMLFDVPFALFLFLQLAAWAFMLTLSSNSIVNEKKSFYTPNVTLSILMFCMFMFGIPWKIKYFSIVGIFQSIDTLLEVCGFALATICLARSKDQLLAFLTIGYLIIVSSDFIIRYSLVSGSIPYLSSFESSWILGLLIVCLGCYLSLKEKRNDEFFSLLNVNSLQAQITIWSLILWLGSILLFFGAYYAIYGYSEHYQITPAFLSILVPFSVLIIIGSSYVSKKISATLYKLESIINTFVKNDNADIADLKKQVEVINNSETHNKEEVFEIYEVEKLCKFILTTINEIQSANRIKENFIMNMSHDFRTPASGIYHMSQTVYKKIHDPELKKLQKLIVNSSGQLMKLLEDVLDHLVLNVSEYELNLKCIDIKSIINDVVTFVAAKVQEKMLHVDCRYPDHPVCCQTDRLMIHRIILNVVSNAVKFTSEGGITISVNVIETDGKKWVAIEVKDTGIGIDKIHHKSIFEPFSRVESPETLKYPGIGLGLSNVYLSLKKLGGKIALESAPYEGSIFNILIPFRI